MRTGSQLSEGETRFADGADSFPGWRLAPVVDLLVNVVGGNAFHTWTGIPNELLGGRWRGCNLLSLMRCWFASYQRLRASGQKKGQTENRGKSFHLIEATPRSSV